MIAVLLALVLAGPCPCSRGGLCDCPECGTGALCCCGDACDCPTYDVAYQRALREDRPLVAFVGQAPRLFPGAISCRVSAATFPSLAGRGFVVAIPRRLPARMTVFAEVKGDPGEEVVRQVVEQSVFHLREIRQGPRLTWAPQPRPVFCLPGK